MPQFQINCGNVKSLISFDDFPLPRLCTQLAPGCILWCTVEGIHVPVGLDPDRELAKLSFFCDFRTFRECQTTFTVDLQ
jgi:hypothetical protein